MEIHQLSALVTFINLPTLLVYKDCKMKQASVPMIAGSP